jgi:polyhydroxyalkanoate synthesis repressor PhaR
VTSKKASGGAKPAQRIIKKYPNRRLYDTDTSTYITLTDVKNLVLDGHPFVVREAKTNEDLTRSILLQIILEEEAGGTPMFSEAALANLIRFYGHTMQGFMGSYLEKNVQAFTDLQTKMAQQSKTFTPEMWTQFLAMQNPFAPQVGNYAEQSKNVFEEMQKQMQKNADQMLGVFGLKK